MGDSPEASDPAPDPQMVFMDKLVSELSRLASSQDEVLRLARIIDERAAEVDDAAQRAREFLRVQLDADLDDEGLQRLMGVIMNAVKDPTGEDVLTEEDRREAFAKAVEDAVSDLPEGQASAYLAAVGRAISGPPSGHYLHRSLMVTLVGELEMLVNSTARACFELKPGALSASEHMMSWNEMSKFNSLDDVRESLVDRVIEDVMRGSLDDWMSFFAKRFSIGKVAASDQFPAQEVLQRRHCIVHNAGNASRLYIKKLERFPECKAIEGERLLVDSVYLREAADILYGLAYSLVWSAGFDLLKDEHARSHLGRSLANECYFLLQNRRFHLVIDICNNAPIKRLPEEHYLILLVNRWLAYKRTGRFQEVEKEVRDFKTATKSKEFQLARLALLDSTEEAWSLAQSMLKNDELSAAHYAAWPLLSEVRAYGESLEETLEVEASTGLS
ncbi:hypothetical protein JAAN108728_15405 [Janibacter anophelis]